MPTNDVEEEGLGDDDMTILMMKLNILLQSLLLIDGLIIQIH